MLYVSEPSESLANVTPTEPTAIRHRLIGLHGFTQNAQCWGRFGDLLSRSFNFAKLDLPGHGQSRHDDADLWRTAELVGQAGGEGVYLGYSMGGRIALHVALATPELVRGLVLVGATAGLRTEKERSDRLVADASLAERLRHDGTEAFLRWWLELPLFGGLSPAAACFDQRLVNRPEGMAASLLGTGTGAQNNLWDRLGEINCPVLLLTGSNDDKFTTLAHQMGRRFGGPVDVVSVRSQAHSVHLQDPAGSAGAVTQWMAKRFS